MLILTCLSISINVWEFICVSEFVKYIRGYDVVMVHDLLVKLYVHMCIFVQW